jgi:hypothetical protein
MTDRLKDLAQETSNQEQDDEDTQAQTVADDAGSRSSSDLGLDDTEKDKSGLDDIDTPDLVDTMRQMESSGTINMDAYRGEETMDDLENKYGARNAADEDFADDDS